MAVGSVVQDYDRLVCVRERRGREREMCICVCVCAIQFS